MRLALVTTCRGRLGHLRQTLPQNIKDCSDNNAVFVVLDYNDQDGMADYIKREHKADLDAETLVYYQNKDATKFHMAHAKNMAHRCAMLEGTTHLVTLDADNYNGPGFVGFVGHRFRKDPELSYLCPDFDGLPPHGQRYNQERPLNLRRGFFGRLAVRVQDFVKAGGYNEVYAMWGGEDVDILARLKRIGFKRGFIHSSFLNAIPHGPDVRFKEWPEARQFENDAIYYKTEKAHDTVVNYGKIGCGVVYRNFDSAPITLDPIPTRVFGVGLQRTGTTSLQHAFESFGFDAGHWKSGEWARTIWQEMNKWGRSRTLEHDYALSDNPIPSIYKKLDEAYPGSKFVLTVRDEDEWIKSVEKFWTYEGNSQRWVWDVDGFSHKMHGITYGRADFHEQAFREVYRRHNDEVINYFLGKAGQLLLIDVNKNTMMNTLQRFLGLSMTEEVFPHSNKSTGQAKDQDASQQRKQ